jgi:hypothetical protein
MYIKTFGDYDPGEQVSRGYTWRGKDDPSQAIFGHKPMEKSLLSGQQVRELVQPEPGTVPSSSSLIVASAIETHDVDTAPKLGKPQSLKFGSVSYVAF